MTHSAARRRKPQITIGDLDRRKLTRLAHSAPDSMADTADELLAELDRARTKAQAEMPAGVVRMGSLVTFRTGQEQDRTVQLVYPDSADIAEGRISVLTPIGAALIGLAEGQSIGWDDRSGRRHELTVLSVRQPEAPAESLSGGTELQGRRLEHAPPAGESPAHAHLGMSASRQLTPGPWSGGGGLWDNLETASAARGET